MITCDLHTHTTFSDGKNTPAEMASEAVNRGLTVLGFSEHSHVPFDEFGGMPKDNELPYRDAVLKVKEDFKDRLEVRLGLEQDLFSPKLPEKDVYEYIIGSVHFWRFPIKDTPSKTNSRMYNGYEYLAVDDTPEIFLEAVNDYFSGDFYSACEDYFDNVSTVIEGTHCTIIGHFDLVSKFNEKYHWFDENHPRYIKAWQKAADKLLSYGLPFEINTGAISRSWRTVPYPAPPILQYLKEKGASFILSSDSHQKGTLLYGFEEAEKLL